MVDATRDLIFACDDRALVKVTVPMWTDKNGNPLDVYIKQFSAADAEAFMKDTDKDGKVSQGRIITSIKVSVCDADGHQIFNKKDDVERLADKNLQVLNWLAEKIGEINFSVLDSVSAVAKN